MRHLLLRLSARGPLFQHAPVFFRENFDELWKHFLPVLQHPLSFWTLGIVKTPLDQAAKHASVFLRQRLQVHHGEVAPFFGEVALLVKDVSNPTAHSGSKISAGLANDDCQTPRHVLAAMVPD